MNVKALGESVVYSISLLLIMFGLFIFTTGVIIPPWVGKGMAVDGLTLIGIGAVIFVMMLCFSYIIQNSYK